MNEQTERVTYILTTGSHDDYKVVGVYSGPPGVSLPALARLWAERFPDKAATLDDQRSGMFDHEHFRDFAIREAGLVEIPSTEIWLPDYGSDMRREMRMAVCPGCDGERSRMYQMAKQRCVETGGRRKMLPDGRWTYLTGDGKEIEFKTIGGWCHVCRGSGRIEMKQEASP